MARLFENLPIAAAGIDPEGVHQARVATRRLRSDLRTFSTLLDQDWANGVRHELAWLATELGQVRDADVLLARLCDLTETLPDVDQGGARVLLRSLEAQRAAHHRDLVAHLAESRTSDLLEHLAAATVDPHAIPEAAARGAPVLAILVKRRWRKLRNVVADLGERPTPAELHRVRILAKRVRYAAEAVAPALHAVEPFVAAIAAMQDALGELNDRERARSWLAGAALTSDNAGAFAAGQLATHIANGHYDTNWRKPYRKAARKKLRAW